MIKSGAKALSAIKANTKAFSFLGDIFLLLSLSLSSFPFLASATTLAENINFSGYIKSYALFQNSVDIDNLSQSIDSNFQSQNSLRLMASYLSSTNGNFEVHYEVQPLYFSNTNILSINAPNGSSNSLGSTISIANTQYRFTDFDAILTEVNDSTVILQNLDRLNYQYSNQYGDLTIGRQVLSFGSSRFINPTDIFIPFVIQTLNQEYRIGIDAIRYQADIDDFAVLDTGLIIGEDAKKEHSAAFIRGKNSINGNDIEAMYIILDDAWLIGGGIERAIGDFGFWFETAFMKWHEKVKFTDANLNSNLKISNTIKAYQDDYWRTSIGSDYAINENIILMLEYHYNGVGSNNPDEYLALSSQAPYQKAGVFLLGQHYIIPAITWLATPLFSVSASTFYNIDDHSIFINIVSETSWTENLYSDFGLYLSSGDNLQYHTSEPINSNVGSLTLGSEFGAYPISFYASLRYYF